MCLSLLVASVVSLSAISQVQDIGAQAAKPNRYPYRVSIRVTEVVEGDSAEVVSCSFGVTAVNAPVSLQLEMSGRKLAGTAVVQRSPGQDEYAVLKAVVLQNGKRVTSPAMMLTVGHASTVELSDGFHGLKFEAILTKAAGAY